MKGVLNGLNCSGVTYMYFKLHPMCSSFHEHSKNEIYFLNGPSIFLSQILWFFMTDCACSASDFFQDWWAEVTHGAKNGGSFSEMMAQAYQTNHI